MTKTVERAWRLDSLDPLGGLAFASYRASEVGADTLDADIPAIFIGAPTFRPMNLASRSVGLAAARRTFQAGLFIKGEEVGFPDLEDAIEFVRRCYVRGGGGAGAGAVGGGGPPRPPEGGPEFPAGPTFEERVEGEGIRLTGALLADLQKYSNLSQDLGSDPPGQSFQMMWTEPPAHTPVSKAFHGTAKTPDGAEVLTHGAVRLIDEMLRRVPVHSKDPEELTDWLVAFEGLVLAIRKMGISYTLMLPHIMHLSEMFNALSRFAVDRKQDFLLTWLEAFPHPFDAMDLVHRLFYWRDIREWTDALDDLQQWPLPSPLQQGLSSPGNGNNPTVLNFLAGFLANPRAANRSPSFAPELDVALFAAARVIAQGARNWNEASDASYFLRSSERIQRLLVGRLAETAWGWLVEQLPARGFGPMVEQAIEQTSSLATA